MQFSETLTGDAYRISQIERGAVTVVRGETSSCLERTFVVTPEQLWTAWGPERHSDLTGEHLQGLLPLQPELVLLGTGATFHPLPPAQLALMSGAGIGIEVMESRAACRTYNLLAGEGRRVVAVIFLE